MQGQIDLKEVSLRVATEKSRPFTFSIRPRNPDTLQPPFFIAAKDQDELDDWFLALSNKVPDLLPSHSIFACDLHG